MTTEAPLDVPSPQKAAALVVALGSRNSANLLRHLTEEEVELLATEVAKMGDLDPDLLDSVLREVYEEMMGHRFVVTGGPQLAKEMLMHWRGARGAEIMERILASHHKLPFGFVRDVEPDQLVQFLKEEHPQTVALILAHQPPSYAAQVMSGLEAELQREVALRVASMGRIAPDVVRKVETTLRSRLGSITSTEATSRGGVKDLAEMLSHSDRATEKAILGRLEEVDVELAEQVRALMFVFEDIVTLDDRSIQQVLQNVDIQMLAKALKGVRQNVHDTILRNVSSRAQERLVEEIEVLGAIRRQEVEEAQSEIVARIRHLDETGEIVIVRERGDLVG